MKKKCRKLKLILAENTGIDPSGISENTNMKTDLDLSSYDLAELACIVEEEFDIEIPNRAITTIKTVGDLISYIQENC